jgi:hypothetical protein
MPNSESARNATMEVGWQAGRLRVGWTQVSGTTSEQSSTSTMSYNSGRLRLPPETGPAATNPYSSCRLPEIVERFYADLVPPV